MEFDRSNGAGTRENDPPVVIGFSRFEGGHVYLHRLFNPEKIAENFKIAGVDIRSVKHALIVEFGNKDFDFLCDASMNQSQSLNIFSDEDSAITWLKYSKEQQDCSKERLEY